LPVATVTTLGHSAVALTLSSSSLVSERSSPARYGC
jgi:hypothetical protein